MSQVHKRNGKQRRLKVSKTKAPPTSNRNHNGFNNRNKQVGDLEFQRAQETTEHMARYYASLFESAPIGYLVLDSAGTVLDVNKAAALLMGREARDIKGKPFVTFTASEQVPDFLEHLRRCRTVLAGKSTELLLQHPDGALIPVEMVTNLEAGRDNSIHYRAALINNSERKRAEQAFLDTERNYRSLVDSIEGIVWEGTEQPGAFTFVSRQTEQILGHPAQRWLLEPDFWEDHLHPADRKRVINARLKAIAEKKGYLIEFRMFDSQRKVVWLRDTARVFRSAHGRVRMRGVMVNITELKEAEEALREETQMLETINRIGTLLTGQLDISKLVAAVTKAGKRLTGAKFGAFFYKRLEEGAEDGLAVHVTPGAPPGIFDKLPQPTHRPGAPLLDAQREAIRIDDVLCDARVPKNLVKKRSSAQVVRSYLAVPVISRSDKLLGALMFAHTLPGVFNDRAQHLLSGIAAEAGIALDNARLYREISRSAAHFRQLADAMPQIVWTAEADGRVDYFNRRWHEFIGQPQNSAGKDWLPFLHPEDCARCTEAWKKSIATGEPFEAECRLQDRRMGNYRWHLIRAVPNRDEHGNLVSWFGTSTDIEDQKQVESEIRDLNSALERRVAERTAQLQASNKELEAFSYSVSHDLRAPLRSIDAFSQLVLEDYQDKLDDQGKEYLGIVGNASRQMGQLIDDLLHLSRVTRSELRRSTVDLTTLANATVANLRQLEPRRNVETIIAPNLEAQGDGQLLRVVFENLINNAWKFTSRKPEARIEVGATGDNGDRRFFVRDNGAGFDMAYSNKLFSAFQRLHSSNEFPGHGIGLATVQRIIHRHGGRIWAEAAVNKGATFNFTLPL